VSRALIAALGLRAKALFPESGDAPRRGPVLHCIKFYYALTAEDPEMSPQERKIYRTYMRRNNLSEARWQGKEISCRNAKETLAVAMTCARGKRTKLPCRTFYSA
jgi:hypothetical protein